MLLSILILIFAIEKSLTFLLYFFIFFDFVLYFLNSNLKPKSIKIFHFSFRSALSHLFAQNFLKFFAFYFFFLVKVFGRRLWSFWAFDFNWKWRSLSFLLILSNFWIIMGYFLLIQRRLIINRLRFILFFFFWI